MTSIRDTILANLTSVSTKKYNGATSLLFLYRELQSYDDFIKSAVDAELYNSFAIEYDTCKKEYLYGDGKYSENVYNDCIEVIKKVIAVL
jgi:hypothetical protein